MIQGVAAITLVSIVAVGLYHVCEAIKHADETRWQQQLRMEQRKQYKEQGL